MKSVAYFLVLLAAVGTQLSFAQSAGAGLAAQSIDGLFHAIHWAQEQGSPFVKADFKKSQGEALLGERFSTPKNYQIYYNWDAPMFAVRTLDLSPQMLVLEPLPILPENKSKFFDRVLQTPSCQLTKVNYGLRKNDERWVPSFEVYRVSRYVSDGAGRFSIEFMKSGRHAQHLVLECKSIPRPTGLTFGELAQELSGKVRFELAPSKIREAYLRYWDFVTR